MKSQQGGVMCWNRCAARYARHFKSTVHTLGLLVLCGGMSACSSGSSNAATREALSNGRTIGLVLANFDYMFYRTEDRKAECPDGFVHTNRENWEAQFPTRAARQRHLNLCGDFQNRGPNCENVWLTPEVIDDPLPFREVRGKIAYGLDLDGEQDGRGTQTTCAHQQFTSPNGERGIDNQYYRFLGCEKGLSLFTNEIIKWAIEVYPVYRLLLEINGVDDERRDDDIELVMYRGRDPLIVDAAGKAAPWQSQRIDEGAQKLIHRLRGKIVDGVVITEPADVIWEDSSWEPRLLIRGMTLRLKLTPTGAEGLRVGYIDVEQLWQVYSHWDATTQFAFGGGASGPAAYAALHRLADGYKDPATGACTALSSTRKFEFVRAFVVHPSKEMTHE